MWDGQDFEPPYQRRRMLAEEFGEINSRFYTEPIDPGQDVIYFVPDTSPGSRSDEDGAFDACNEYIKDNMILGAEVRPLMRPPYDSLQFKFIRRLTSDYHIRQIIRIMSTYGFHFIPYTITLPAA